jgi:F420-dependent oxidoreductase-like protein
MLPHRVGVGTFIGVGRALETALQRVERAESLGYESAYVTHIAGRDSLTVLAAYATRSRRIKLGTGVLPIHSRTPVATAQAAATVDELSGGRMVLGLGISHRVTVENWYGTKIEKPVAEMREYTEAVRAMFRGEDATGDKRFPTRFRFMGYEPRADLPIYIAALSPAMLRLAGEIADGAMLWLCNPEYIRSVVVPELTKGRERAGKSLDGFDIVAAVPAAVTDDVDVARASLRGELIPYFSLPFYRAMIERSGFEDDIAGFDTAMAGGDMESAAGAISDNFLEQLAAIGDPTEAAGAVERYREAGATSPCLGAVPRTDFDLTLKSLAGLAGA